MTVDFSWAGNLELDVRFGYLHGNLPGPRRFHPQVVLNGESTTTLRVLREELTRCSDFTFSVAFVSARGVALLKQELLDFSGAGRIITSDYLAFNSPAAFAELLNLRNFDIDVRIHEADAFHPKGYIFQSEGSVSVMMGSSNLTESALVSNHEWNLKVSAAQDSDLGHQLRDLVRQQVLSSTPLSQQWIDDYAAGYVAPPPRSRRRAGGPPIGVKDLPADVSFLPNSMQREALMEIAGARQSGARRALIVSATGTGKTVLSALDVRAVAPQRFLFVVHREQILDRTIREYRKVLGGPASDFGKLAGATRQTDAEYLFATVQTLSRPEVLSSFARDAFNYITIDEAHRCGAESHRRVMSHFTPDFLLGMTATPERMDGFNVFEVFDFVTPYEIRLNAALENDMLAPFHYYGVADVTFEDGTTTDDATLFSKLVSHERVDHVISALEAYGQAGVPPRGLIFCSRVEESRVLATELSKRSLRGKQLRVASLNGEDSVAHREEVVRELEAGDIDYITTVDVFNEGIDIPTLNQIIMLRQTQSSIVFVQQLGRGLRKAPDKDYLVVIDFIGNYANNFMIPIALFGDQSLNKESLRRNLISSEESGVIAGLSSVRFDRIAQARVLKAITEANLGSKARLKAAVVAMRNRVGRTPRLMDFLHFDSTDPVVLALGDRHFPALAAGALKQKLTFSPEEDRWLHQISWELLPAKRRHEFVLLRELAIHAEMSRAEVAAALAEEGLDAQEYLAQSAMDSLTLVRHAQVDRNRHSSPIAVPTADGIKLVDGFVRSYRDSRPFREAVDDAVETGWRLVGERYALDAPFTRGAQYSRKETTRQLGQPRSWAPTLYGYKVDMERGVCAIFITLHKADDVTASVAYEDALLDPTTIQYFTKSRRTLNSASERAMAENRVTLHVFVKKDDSEGSDFFYLGVARASQAANATMPDGKGSTLPVVTMLLKFEEPIPAALFDYFHPALT